MKWIMNLHMSINFEDVYKTIACTEK